MRPRRSAIAELTDRDLVRLYWPVELRPAFDALFAIDDALAEVVASSTQPALGAIRLAWWREALERLDTSTPPPEPRLKTAAAELLPRGITGAMLAELEDSWQALMEEQPDAGQFLARGELLFAMGATLLGADDERLGSAGKLFAAGQFHRKRLGTAPNPATLLHELAGYRVQRRARPLTALARLAARDLYRTSAIEPEATPARALALIHHRFFGTVA